MRKISLEKTDSSDWKVKLDVASQKITGSLTYTDDEENWIARAPELGSAHPDFPGLLLSTLEATLQPGGIMSVQLSYEGNNPEASYPGRKARLIKRYHMELGTGEEPILRNQLFDNLSDDERQALQEYLGSDRSKEAYEKARAAVDPEPFSLAALKKLLKGIEAFLNPSLTWQESYTTKNLSDLDLEKVGKIMDAPGPAPELGEGRNWLYMGANATMTNDGKFFDVTRSWQASLSGGWDPDLYGE